MGRLFKGMARIINLLTQWTGWAAAICLVVSALIVTEGIVVRKVFGASTIWQIEASVFLLIYSVFGGAPLVQKNEHHLNVDLVLIHLPPRMREMVLICVSILTAVLAAVLAWYAWPMWWEALAANDHSESLWGPPLWIPYLFLPLGMTLLFLQYLVHIANGIKALRRGEYDQQVVPLELRDIKIDKND